MASKEQESYQPPNIDDLDYFSPQLEGEEPLEIQYESSQESEFEEGKYFKKNYKGEIFDYDIPERHYGLLSDAEKAELWDKYNHAPNEEIKKECVAKIYELNIPIIYDLAWKFSGRGIDVEELVQEGSRGFLRAIEKYDETKGNELSTYETPWIRGYMTRAIAEKSRTIKLPVHIHEKLQSYRKAKNRAINEKELLDIYDYEKIQEYEKLEQTLSTISIEKQTNNKEDDHIQRLEEHIPGEKSFENELVDKLTVKELLQVLTPDERTVIAYKFCLVDGTKHPSEELAKMLGWNVSTINNIQKRALIKMRHAYGSRY